MRKSNMSKSKRKKIIWAIDPYGKAKVQASAASLARLLSLHNDVEVIYVHGHSGSSIAKEQSAVRGGLSRVDKQLDKILLKLKFKPRRKPLVLVHDSDYLRTDVKTLVSFAKKAKADAVLVSTNARVGFIRQALGSFSETLILESAAPTMIINPKAKVRSKPGTIIFPTDFSDLSWKAFQQVVSFAKATRANIKIFHQYQGEARSILDCVYCFQKERWLERDNRLLNNNLQRVKSNLTKWLNWTKKQNVKCDHIIQFGSKNIADATLELAKKHNAWMIAMATIIGPIAANFLGSNARWIVRSANCPVWVLYVEGK